MRLESPRWTTDSYSSETTLSHAMNIIIPYTRSRLYEIGWSLKLAPSISLYECQSAFHSVGGPPPNEKNKKYGFKTDAPILMAQKGEETYVLSMIEDKVQGRNDIRFKECIRRQCTGNAIERAAKNIRAADMRTSNQPFFPYIVFASGCDFHHTETISKRLDIMNYGFPPYYTEVSRFTTKETMDENIEAFLPLICVKKKLGKSVANIFIKAHKWDEMEHGSSNWSIQERIKIIKTVIDRSIEFLPVELYESKHTPHTNR